MSVLEIAWAVWCGFLIITAVILAILYTRDTMDKQRERRTVARQAMLNIPMEDQDECA